MRSSKRIKQLKSQSIWSLAQHALHVLVPGICQAFRYMHWIYAYLCYVLPTPRCSNVSSPRMMAGNMGDQIRYSITIRFHHHAPLTRTICQLGPLSSLGDVAWHLMVIAEVLFRQVSCDVPSKQSQMATSRCSIWQVQQWQRGSSSGSTSPLSSARMEESKPNMLSWSEAIYSTCSVFSPPVQGDLHEELSLQDLVDLFCNILTARMLAGSSV